MSYLLPKTLKAQAILILCAIFIVSHVISFVLYESNREKTVLLTEATDLAARIVGIVTLADSFPNEDRLQILAAAETQFLAMFPDTDKLGDSACQHNTFSERMDAYLSQAFAPVPGIFSEVCLREFSSTKLLPFVSSRHGFDVLITINFPDGEQAVFHAFLPEGESLLRDTILVYLFISLFFALLIAGYLIRKTVFPLERLAKAADEIGIGSNNFRLQEHGSQEVLKAARAFNQMQDRINRLAHAQTEMLTAISHDLRSAVTRLQLRTELLENDEEREVMLRVVQDMRSMIQSVLDFVRGLEPSEPLKKMDLVTLVESLCEDLCSEGYPLGYTSILDESKPVSWHTNCRPVAFRRALQNIIDNAIKYGKRAHLTTRIENGHFLISVEDEGPGIPDDQLDNIMQPFFRLEKSRNSDTGGIGLGLSIANNIIQEYGGKITALNTDRGLCVTISLPQKIPGFHLLT